MVTYPTSPIDRIFAARAEPTRRHVLQSLADHQGQSLSDLTRPLSLKLPGLMKHLNVLSDPGLVTCTNTGRTVCLHLAPEPMRQAMDWLEHYRRFLTASPDTLATFVESDPAP